MTVHKQLSRSTTSNSVSFAGAFETDLQKFANSNNAKRRDVPKRYRDIVYTSLRKAARLKGSQRTENRLVFELARVAAVQLRTVGEDPVQKLTTRRAEQMISMYAAGLREFFPESFQRDGWADVPGKVLELHLAMRQVSQDDVFEEAVDLAVAQPVAFTDRKVQSNPQLRMAASIAYHLNSIRGDRYFIFPVARLGAALGRTTVHSAANLGSSCIAALVDAGVLYDPSGYNFNKGKAREYSFNEHSLAADSERPERSSQGGR